MFGDKTTNYDLRNQILTLTDVKNSIELLITEEYQMFGFPYQMTT